jgi:transposase
MTALTNLRSSDTLKERIEIANWILEQDKQPIKPESVTILKMVASGETYDTIAAAIGRPIKNTMQTWDYIRKNYGPKDRQVRLNNFRQQDAKRMLEEGVVHRGKVLQLITLVAEGKSYAEIGEIMQEANLQSLRRLFDQYRRRLDEKTERKRKRSAQRKAQRDRIGPIKETRAERKAKVKQTLDEKMEALSIRRKAIADYYQETGSDLKALTEKFGLSRTTIRHDLRIMDIDPPNWPRSGDIQGKSDRMEYVQELAGTGLSISQIASQTGYGYSTVARYFKDMGLAVTPNEYWCTPTESRRICDVTERNVILRRMSRGMNVSEMAVADGVNRDLILQSMARLGIDIPEGEAWVRRRDEIIPFIYNKTVKARYWKNG